MLPNSLTRVLPFALVYSTRLPVSVCGTGIRDSTFRGFSWQQGSAHFHLKGTSPDLNSNCGFTYSSQRLTSGAPALPIAGWPTSLRPLFTHLKWYRNVDRLSITYAFRPRLRPRLTRRGMTWRRKPKTYGEHGSHVFYATHACILTSVRSSRPSGRPSPQTERSPTTPAYAEIHSFGTMLSPVKFSAQDHLTSELLRTL
jgi:hypothetical protein